MYIAETFDLKLPWFSDNLSAIDSAFAAERLAHGLIICAPTGSGKRDFADYLINSILCNESKTRLASPCGKCKSCQLLIAKTHPDFYLLDRLEDNKGKQKKSIGIDQVRALITKLTDTPQLGGWRVALITSVEFLNRSSFNALLKTLEEPGNKTLLIILADNAHTIPATVKSRCQIQQPNLSSETIKMWLNQSGINDEQTIKTALDACYNAPLKTLDFLKNEGQDKLIQFYQNCDLLLTNQLDPAGFIESSQLDPIEIWRMLAQYFCKVANSILTNTDNRRYQLLPPSLPFQLYAKVCEYNRAQYSGSNLQPNLQLQAILIQWFESGRKQTRFQ